MIRTYSALVSIQNFNERFNYLKLDGTVGTETFGFDRYLNQELYHSQEWKRFRRDIIIRDNGCDLGVEGMIIPGLVLIHHLNPITVDDIIKRHTCVFDPENVISVSLNTHNAIHYGDEKLLKNYIVLERSKNDTCPWKH